MPYDLNDALKDGRAAQPITHNNGCALEALENAFDNVANVLDWKAPIRAMVAEADLEVTLEAIRFYTATEPSTCQQHFSNGTFYLVSSVGYREGPAGP